MLALNQAQLIFWDFDGVIKDSIDVKTDAFVNLFRSFGKDVMERVRKHHLANGGMSRFDKLPLYLLWAGQESTPARVDELCDQFSHSAFEGVIHSPWVPGAEQYLRSNSGRQIFVVVSATPQEELEQILHALDLSSCFASVFGAPVNKKHAIRESLKQHMLQPQHCLMIGDAYVDLEAAEANGVPFLLRRHRTNADVFGTYTGLHVKDFSAL
jgi:phosphoglycolate phosphatase-like HAD superfamily hydrolase